MDARLEQALHDLEVSATSFALRYIRIADVRTAYVQQIHEMSQSLRAAVEAGHLGAKQGAEMANQMRNEIMEMQRLRDFDYGRSLARQMKGKGVSLEQAIAKAMKTLGVEGKPFATLSGAEYLEVLASSGRSRASVTAGIPKLRWASRGLWLATLIVAGYNIGTSENPWWQTGREAANIAGGVGGGFAGGAAMGAAVGVWGGPVGVAVGVLVGGILGALLADRAYIEVVGTSDASTRSFIGRFTSFWIGTDEAGIANALATEHRTNSAFVHRVLVSLNDDYNSDADDVAVIYVGYARRDTAIRDAIKANQNLRDYLIKVMTEGYTSADEQSAIAFLKTL
jgi:hypothetical protein